jgi:hypothetical protein
MQSGFHIHKTPGLGVFHGFFELVWNPRIIVFHDEPGYLRPFVCRQLFNLLNNFGRTHGLIISQNSFLARRSAEKCFTRHLTPALSPNSVGGEGETFAVPLKIRTTGFAGRSSAKPESANGDSLSCPSSLCFDVIAPERKAKAEGRG